MSIIALFLIMCAFMAKYVVLEDRHGKYTLLIGLPGSGKTAIFNKVSAVAAHSWMSVCIFIPSRVMLDCARMLICFYAMH